MYVINIWHLASIHEIERTLSERLVLKTAEYLGGLGSGALSSKWDKIFYRKSKDINELNQLRELLLTVREAEKSAQKYCDAYQAQLSFTKDKKYDALYSKFVDLSLEDNNSKELSALCFMLLDYLKEHSRPNELEILHRAIKDMKKTIDEIEKNKSL